MIESAPAARAAAPGRRELRKQVTRRELLAAGRRLFSERGLYESRIEDVADRARIAKGTLYLYFRDKDDLILAVVSESFEELRAYVDLRRAGGASPPLRAERLVESHLRFLALHPDRMRILHQARGLLLFHTGRWQSLRAVFAAHLDWIAACLAESIEGAALSPARRRERARLLFGAVSGVVSVQEATGASLRALLRRPGLAPGLAEVVAAPAGSVRRAAVRSRTHRTVRKEAAE